ncbi:MAG: polymer-forming cytoskeletal protein [Fulvivirga sp.]|uniref:bactofilin family protein n=1 Tax=Fulvivirga sp. TaxID=1931237 RepID=UPI0032EF49EE
MFNNNDKQATAEAMNSNNIIGKGTTFTGNIETYGNIRIEGKVVGDIISKSKVAVGPSAVIEGKLLAQIAEIEGEIKGKLEVTDHLILKPTSKIEGDIIANKLTVESGARFDGQCKMGEKNLKIELKNDSQEVKKLRSAV